MINVPGFLLFTLILMRMTGFVLMNPIFGRRTIPGIVKSGFILVLTINMFSFNANQGVYIDITNSLEYGGLLLKEFFMGYIIGFILEIFFSIVAYAGGVIDFNMGMSMATVYDPQNNISMPITGSVYNAMMILLLFAVDGHLALLKIMIESEQVIPYGQFSITPQAISAILTIFTECVVLAMKLAFPVLALELLAEVGVGILMRVIPQIDVFVVNIQVKVMVGNFLLLLLCVPVGAFLSDVITMMVNSITQVLTLL